MDAGGEAHVSELFSNKGSRLRVTFIWPLIQCLGTRDRITWVLLVFSSTTKCRRSLTVGALIILVSFCGCGPEIATTRGTWIGKAAPLTVYDRFGGVYHALALIVAPGDVPAPK